MTIWKGARYLLQVARGLEHGPIRRLELLTDDLELRLRAVGEVLAAAARESSERRGSVMVLALEHERRMGSSSPLRGYIASRSFSGRKGETADGTIMPDIPLARPLWIACVGHVELVQCVLNNDIQTVQSGWCGPVCLVDQPFELGSVLRVAVRFV